MAMDNLQKIIIYANKKTIALKKEEVGFKIFFFLKKKASKKREIKVLGGNGNSTLKK
jgi:hypothetical protein